MPSIINATTTNGVAISPDNSGSLQLATNNGTTAVTIDTSQNVGIGTSSPTSKLHVKDGAVNIENTSGYGVIEMGGSSGAFLDMKNPFSDDYDLRLQTDGSTAFLITAGSIPMTFQTNNTERMRITSGGNVGIGTNNPVYPLQVSAGSSGSIAFMVNPSGLTNFAVIPSNSGSTGTQIGTTGGDTLAFITNNTERMRITSGGNLLVGTTTDSNNRIVVSAASGAAAGRFIVQSTSASDVIYFANPNGVVGSIVTNGSSTSYNTSSDYRLKENVAPMTGALEKVAKLKPCTYTWKVNGFAGQGFIAHELQAVVPDAVTGEKDAVETYTDEEGKEQTRPKYQGVDTSFLVATLTAAIQELKAELDTVKAELNTLKNPPVEGTE